MLRSMAISNGPFFISYRVMDLSTSHIFPTMVVLIVLIVLLVICYFPFQTFNGNSPTLEDYCKDKGFQILDSAYFITCRMMYFYIGKLIAN